MLDTLKLQIALAPFQVSATDYSSYYWKKPPIPKHLECIKQPWKKPEIFPLPPEKSVKIS